MKETTFLDKCKGIALVFGTFGLMLFGAAALMFSTSPVQANNAPQTTYGTGKYQMDVNVFVSPDNITTWYVLVWNTETGQSQMYYGDVSNGVSAAREKYNLPSSPL